MKTPHVHLVTPDGTRLRLAPDPGDRFARCADGVTCPACGVDPLCVAGCGVHPGPGHDELTAAGRCYVCDADVGQIVAKVSTIFGTAEDTAVETMARRNGWALY